MKKNNKNEALQSTIAILDNVFGKDVDYANMRTKAYNICRPFRNTGDSLWDIAEMLEYNLLDNINQWDNRLLLANSLCFDIKTNKSFFLEHDYQDNELDNILHKLCEVIRMLQLSLFI